MKKQLKFVGLCIITLGLTFCSQSENSELYEATGLEIQNKDYLKGSIYSHDHIVVYEVEETTDMNYQVNLRMDQFEFKVTVDYNTEDITFETNNAILSTDQKGVFIDLGKNLTGYLFKERSLEQFTMAEYTLLRLLEYWAKSPYQYQYNNRVIKGGKSNGFKGSGEGVTCIRLGSNQIASYDDKQGNQYRESIRIQNDDENCFGMCGLPRCPGKFDLPRAWTKDCLDHDVCGTRLGGLYNPFDRDCNDEYNQAFDDFLFGLLRGCKA